MAYRITNPKCDELTMIKRWHENDLKGNRLRNYFKEVGKRNSSIMTIVPQTRLEIAHNMTDGHKCLNFRKKVNKVRINVSDAAYMLT